MLDTALAQFRYGMASAFGRRVRASDVHKLVRDVVAARAEHGGLDEEQLEQMRGAAIDPEMRRLIAERRMRKLLRIARDRTPFYGARFRSLGIGPRDVSLDTLHELPVTTRAELKSLPEAFVSRTASPVLRATTTGTTGEPTSIWFSRYELDVAAGFGAIASVVNLGWGPEVVVQSNISSRAMVGVLTGATGCALIGAAFDQMGIVDPEEALGRLAAPVHAPGKTTRVSILSTYASYLGLLVDVAEASGHTPADFELRQIVCGGEVLSDALRRRAEDVFGAELVDIYGMTEIFPLGGTACSQGHLHLSVEQGVMEIVDVDTGRPAAPGRVGTLVVTPFYPFRETTLLFRFDTGDLVRTLDDTELTCELAALPATSPVLGKRESSVQVGDVLVTDRDVRDVVDADRGVPLPARFVLSPGDGGVDVDVLVRPPRDDAEHRLVAAFHRAGVPVAAVRCHVDRSTMPRMPAMRCDLRETTFTRRMPAPERLHGSPA